MTINLHGGPLPKYRGGSPLNWQIINQEKNFVELINFINSLSNLDKLSFSLNIGTIIVNVDILYFQ